MSPKKAESEPWYTNLNPELPVTVSRPGVFHKISRLLDWELEYKLGPHTQYCAAPPAFRLGVQGDTPLKKRTTEDAKTGSFNNSVVLPQIGGVYFDVKVTKAPDQGSDNVNFVKKYVTWRKVFLTVNYMDDACRDLFNAVLPEVKAIFAKVYIELVEHHAARCPGTPVDVNVLPAFIVGDAATLPALHTPRVLEHGPNHLRVVIVRDLAQKVSSPANRFRLALAGTPDFIIDAANATAIIKTVNRETWVERDFAMTQLILRNNITDKGLPLTADELKALTTVEKAADGTIQFKLPLTGKLAPLLDSLRLGQDWWVSPSWDWTQSMAGGYTVRTPTIVVTTIRKPDALDVLHRTPAELDKAHRTKFRTAICHEFAHALRMVKRTEPVKRADGAFRRAQNPKWFVGMGGMGPHCDTGSTVQAGMRVPQAGQPLCIMFHSVGDTAQDAFCVYCEQMLQRVPIDIPTRTPDADQVAP